MKKTILKYGEVHEGFCHVALQNLDEASVVLVTELVDNPGPSVTNAIEIIAETVCNQFQLNEEQLILVEKYYDREEYDLVSFQTITNSKFIGPSWHRLKEAEVIALNLVA